MFDEKFQKVLKSDLLMFMQLKVVVIVILLTWNEMTDESKSNNL